MDPDERRRAWDDVAATYARRRDPTGSDADLLDDLRASLPSDPTVLDVGCGDEARTLDALRAAGFGAVRTETVSDPLGSDAEFVIAEYDPGGTA